MDGDGQVDIGYKDTFWRVRRHSGGISDLVKTIADGLRQRRQLRLRAADDSQRLYQRHGAGFPILDVITPMYVVKSYSPNDGIGGSYTVTEKYTQARAHLQGRGYLGFGSRTTIDSRNSIKSITNFRQDYPYVGIVDKAYVYQANGTTVISETSNTLSVKNTSVVTNQERRFYLYRNVSAEVL